MNPWRSSLLIRILCELPGSDQPFLSNNARKIHFLFTRVTVFRGTLHAEVYYIIGLWVLASSSNLVARNKLCRVSSPLIEYVNAVRKTSKSVFEPIGPSGWSSVTLSHQEYCTTPLDWMLVYQFRR